MRWALTLTLLVGLFFSTAVKASDDEAFTAQFGLIFAGLYTGPVDGILGPRSRNAIATFQRQLGEPTTGRLTQSQFQRLERQMENAIYDLAIFPVYDEGSGVWLYLPGALVSAIGPTARGFRFAGEDARIELETIGIPASERSFAELYERLAGGVAGRSVDYSALADDWLVVQAQEGNRRLYTRFYTNGHEHRGFSIAFDIAAERRLLPMVYFISELFTPFWPVDENAFPVPSGLDDGNSQEIPAPPAEIGSPEGEDGERSQDEPALFSSGTGFFANREGVIVTNAHVVGDCRRVELGDGRTVSVDYLDRALDIALLQASPSNAYLHLSEEALSLGEKVVALGYPLASILDGGLRVSEGIVSGLTGLRGDSTRFSMTAPIQAGNSGGPILDDRGQVVGVVVSVLAASRVLENGGPLPQNVNFGIRPEALSLAFNIAGHTMASRNGKGDDVALSTEEIITRTASAVVQIYCYQ